ncbi:zinc-dependent peptidase [Pinibacter soli]|uniref:Zinc-dependent peptidase n=1 Tax=Pinibacter soli TaxID=3044211 RepID=A0ABT6R6X1_9BACT|nr:zinc-dependent peptidase [Pinibacter soli]MDI3318309.1 zinc-dependent peptidase [Pinibacter soli]
MEGTSSDQLFTTLMLAGGIFLVAVYFFASPLRRFFFNRKITAIVEAELTSNWKYYDNLLCNHNIYYKKLDAENRTKFISRVLHFRHSKEFEFVQIEAQPEMPILVSAAAIQLTFGLDHYLLDFFKKIYITECDYYYGLNQTPFQGHVSSQGIYLSWNNFLKGYRYYDDAQNLGLHEMAHALAYTNFVAHEDMDYDFIARFYRFSKTARPIFNRMQMYSDAQISNDTLLDNYAATNYNEFWAVCVETFFEKPTQLYEQIPELYTALSDLLNQNLLATTGISN